MFSKLFDFNTTENNKYFLTQKEKFLEKEKTNFRNLSRKRRI